MATLTYAPRMTEAEKLQEKFEAARRHPQYHQAMSTPPVTWLTMAIFIVAVMAVSLTVTFYFYPWEAFSDRRMPGFLKGMMMFSWIPTIGFVVASLWLLFDAATLAMLPGRAMLAVVGVREHTPAPYYIRLIGEDGTDRDYRARRRAASAVKLDLNTPGDVGVAIFKGDICVEWIPLPLHADRVYDRR